MQEAKLKILGDTAQPRAILDKSRVVDELKSLFRKQKTTFLHKH